jgi:hypothetical protein
MKERSFIALLLASKKVPRMPVIAGRFCETP